MYERYSIQDQTGALPITADYSRTEIIPATAWAIGQFSAGSIYRHSFAIKEQLPVYAKVVLRPYFSVTHVAATLLQTQILPGVFAVDEFVYVFWGRIGGANAIRTEETPIVPPMIGGGVGGPGGFIDGGGGGGGGGGGAGVGPGGGGGAGVGAPGGPGGESGGSMGKGKGRAKGRAKGRRGLCPKVPSC